MFPALHPLTRRSFVALASSTMLTKISPAMAAAGSQLKIIAQSPFMCSGVAVTTDQNVFLGLPRFPGMEASFSVGRVTHDGVVVPFPGNSWNEWKPGQDGSQAFVMVNAIHIFADDTLWVVDQGAPPGINPEPGAQKLVQMDTKTGNILNILRFPESILPPGGQFNDLRIQNDLMLIADSGLGGVIIHNLKTGKTIRRLSGQPVAKNDQFHIHKGKEGRILEDGQGHRPHVETDQLEIDATGTWFYFAVPAGPLKKIRMTDLLNEHLSETHLARKVEIAAEIPSIGGTCIDTMGNIYLADAENSQIVVLSPSGKKETLIKDERLISPDALFIDQKRNLYIPCPQIQNLAMFNKGIAETHAPFLVFSLPLPQRLGNIRLGSVLG